MTEAPRRSFRRRALALALLATLVGVVIWISQSAPDETSVARLMSRVIGLPVELDEFEINLGWQLELELGSLRVRESDAPDAKVLFKARKLRGRQPWPRVLAGQLLPPAWVIDQPHLRLHASADGAAAPSLPDVPPLDLDLRRGTLEWERAPGDVIVISDIKVRARRGRLGRRTTGTLSAAVARGERPIVKIEADFEGWLQDLQAKGRMEGLDLAALSPDDIEVAGLGSGSFELDFRGAETRLAVDLEAEGLRIALESLAAPIEATISRLAGAASWRDENLALTLDEIRLDGLSASGKIDVPAGDSGRVSGELQLADFLPADKKLHPLRLMGLRFETFANINRNIRAGRIENLRVGFDLPRESWARSLSFGRKLGAGELSVSLRVRNGVYRQSGGPALRNISGSLQLHGDVIEVNQVHVERDGEPLPKMDVRLDGMHRLVHLTGPERTQPHGAGVDTPGLGPALDSLSGSGNDNSAPTLIEFQDLFVSYPAFIFPLRDASGTLSVSGSRIHSKGARGVFGGAPAEVDFDFDRKADRLAVNVRYLSGAAGPAAKRGSEWIDGQIGIASLKLGDWRIESGRFRLRADGAQVSLDDVEGAFGGGRLIGAGSITLDREGTAPYAFGLQLFDADAAPLSAHIGLTEGSITGEAFANGLLAGQLARGTSFIDHGDLNVSVRLENGSLGRLPPALALARLPSLQGVRSLLGRPLPYKQLTTNVRIRSGKLELTDFKLDGPELRILADGVIDLNTPEQDMDMVVALLFLETIDRLLGSLPIVRDVVLGKDKNLVAAYFRLDGPRANPRARILAPDALSKTGGMISGGMRRLRDLIPIGKKQETGNGETKDDPRP